MEFVSKSTSFIDNTQSVEDFWKPYMNGFAQTTLLPFVQKKIVSNNEGNISEIHLEWTEDISGEIETFIKSEKISYSVLVKAVWAKLLSEYSNQEEVLFGVGDFQEPFLSNSSEEDISQALNIIPFCVQVSSQNAIGEWLTYIQGLSEMLKEYQDVSPVEIQHLSKQSDDLLDSFLIFDKKELNKKLLIQLAEQNHYPLTIIPSASHNFGICFLYNSELLTEEDVQLIKGHFDQTLTQIVIEKPINLGAVKIITVAEEKQLIYDFNSSEMEQSSKESIIELFEAQAAQKPDHIAVIYNGHEWTYRSLNEQANKIAHHLQSLYDVRSNDLVGFVLESSSYSLLALLAILKTGAAYLPIDNGLPSERKQSILANAAVKVLIVESSTRLDTNESVVFELDSNFGHLENKPDNLGVLINKKGLAYVIYTSGTTGEPKGIMVSHENLLDYFSGLKQKINISDCQSFGLMSTMTADLGNTGLFSALLYGGTIHLFDKTSLTDANKLHQYFEEYSIDCIKIVPSHWKALKLKDKLLLPKKMIIFGGEALPVESSEQIFNSQPEITIINHYGPTETTIGKLLHRLNPKRKYSVIPVGQIFSNTQCYVVNKDLQLCPIGIPGELLIGGDGLSLGYLNREDLTKEKFINNPFLEQGTKVYRTGDIVKRSKNGEIVFLGRADNQIKIRGYRVELTGIEFILQKIPMVSQAVVLVQKDHMDQLHLVGYVVTEKVGEAIDQKKIREYLLKELPEYMVPYQWVELDAMPLTSNGKIDKKALPNPISNPVTTKDYVAPRNEIERLLQSIWIELFNVKTIGIHDNFFELGGDSIMSIQIASRARTAGYRLQVSDLFDHQTIASLATIVKESVQEAEAREEPLEGMAPLLPIQARYLNQGNAKMEHFNQAVLLEISKGGLESHLKEMLQCIVERHDALRFSYTFQEDTWIQQYTQKKGNLNIIDLQKTKEDLGDKITQVCQFYQESLNLKKGEVFKLVWIKTPESEAKNRLFIIAHHLVIDAVSWRILIDDMEKILDKLSMGSEVNLGRKSSSYRTWGENLKKHAASSSVMQQHAYWRAIGEYCKPIPVDKTNSEFLKKNQSEYFVSLDKELTHALLRKSNQAYNTQINDLLLSALTQTLGDWSEQEVVIGMEGYGREDLFENIELFNTIGWFTTIYPIVLFWKKEIAPGQLIKSVKEQLRGIPENGLGYGLLRYLHPSAAVRKSLESVQWEIVFNYLGQLDNAVEMSNWFAPATESTGEDISNQHFMPYKLAINSSVREGQLTLSWTYSTEQYDTQTIAQLAEDYLKNLIAIIQHCTQKEEEESTLSDFGLNGKISEEELSILLSVREEEDDSDEIMKF